ncbi:MAG TPA: hypothetical protein VJ346_08510 [Bacteroidales bacterium]|nr:hypothetical protein [Bacteroidales bacterium]
MNTIPIKVKCYSGYKANEYPTCFYWKDERFDIREISDRWYQGDNNPEYPVANYFKVITIHDRQYLIKHEVESDRWYLITQDEHKIL